ncbi:MAG: hypothetical protein E7390_01110 [Ruminococcaceae bacterium]|nr:hypothetical protein [Oscillospiraceae bacterium]
MKLHAGDFTINIDEKTGSILSVKNRIRDFLTAEQIPVLTVSLLNDDGEQKRISTDLAKKVQAIQNGDILSVLYTGIGNCAFDAEIKLWQDKKDGMLHRTMSFDNRTEKPVEWVEFGSVAIPLDLKYNGGESVVYTSFTEGGLIEDITLREKYMGTKYCDISYMHRGMGGLYPGTGHMQFMAYYSEKGGIYFAAHDENYHLKKLEVRRLEKGLCLEHRVMPGGVLGKWEMGYDIVIGGFYGDWYDAADLYRSWFENSALRPVPLKENKALPAWMDDSPVIIIYPVRGRKDTEDMTPNCYYPFEEGVKYVNRISEKLGCCVMALMMHWEGTAPWAPPFVWPPYGGEEGFKKAVRMLHEKGNLAGVYCSGIGWTTESYLEPGYNAEKAYEAYEMENCVCRSPKEEKLETGSLEGIRRGYSVCPAHDTVSDIVAEEVGKIAESGCDYCQFFDQNWGGNTKFCYSGKHGHPRAPGKWMTEGMLNIQKKANGRIREAGSEMLLGTESAAAEPFIGQLPFNDLRFIKWYYYGIPVPAYSYITHEYANNFAGNFCGAAHSLDIRANPSNLAFTLGYAFAAGNMLSVVLASAGQMHWAWCVDEKEDGVPENQEELWQFVAHLNAWRCGNGKPFLRFGRMEKPEKIGGIGTYRLLRKDGTYAEFTELLYTKWSFEDDSAQFVVNFHDTEKSFYIEKDVWILDAPDKSGYMVKAKEKIYIKPFSAVMLKKREEKAAVLN